MTQERWNEVDRSIGETVAPRDAAPDATAIQTVGGKGYDSFARAVVRKGGDR